MARHMPRSPSAMARARPCISNGSTRRAASSARWRSGGRRPAARRWRTLPRARARGDRLAADLGLDASGTPDVRPGPDDTGWTLTWPRVVDGVPVIGDGVRVDLWPDGRIHAVVRTERPLAARPSVTLDEATARDRATAELAALLGDHSARIRISTLGLGWVAPNDAFDPTAPDAPGRHAASRLGRRGAHVRRPGGSAPRREALPGRGDRNAHRGRRPPMSRLPPTLHRPSPGLGRARRRHATRFVACLARSLVAVAIAGCRPRLPATAPIHSAACPAPRRPRRDARRAEPGSPLRQHSRPRPALPPGRSSCCWRNDGPTRFAEPRSTLGRRRPATPARSIRRRRGADRGRAAGGGAARRSRVRGARAGRRGSWPAPAGAPSSSRGPACCHSARSSGRRRRRRTGRGWRRSRDRATPSRRALSSSSSPAEGGARSGRSPTDRRASHPPGSTTARVAIVQRDRLDRPFLALVVVATGRVADRLAVSRPGPRDLPGRANRRSSWRATAILVGPTAAMLEMSGGPLTTGPAMPPGDSVRGGIALSATAATSRWRSRTAIPEPAGSRSTSTSAGRGVPRSGSRPPSAHPAAG